MKNKKIFIHMGIIFIVIVPLFLLYFWFCNSPIKKYEYNLKTSIRKVNSINNDISPLIKGQTIDTDNCKKNIPKKISSLIAIKNDLNKTKAPEKYALTQENFLLGLDNNIHIYEQILGIVNNPQAKDISNSCKNLKMYNKHCINYYSLCKINNVKINFKEDYLNYLNTCIKYSGELENTQKSGEIKQSQYRTFIDNMDEVLSCFLEIKIDMNETKCNIKNNSISYDNILSKVDNMKTEFEDILYKFSKITVPSEAISCYTLFSKTLDNYNSYIQNFRYAITTEKNSSSNKSKTVDALYNETNLNYKIMDTNYNKFLTSYSNFKTLVDN
ncbi:hypothetical protein [Clostridium rectalis]|uniref:hypothetical protein n=1 Tax=Clostridium rectalis TaxID=2040295 RepID=UPI000F63C437|nr:hypothetical protein [Clostridium rectalis]